MDSPKSSRRFEITRKGVTCHYLISSPSTTLFVDVSVFTRGTPDLVFHAGPSTSAPTAAVAHFPSFSGDMSIGLGNPSSASEVHWEELKKDKMDASRYSFSFPVRGERKDLAWKRTRHAAVDGMAPATLSQKNYKLVDDGGEVLAVFTDSWAPRKVGTLQINVDYGDDFETMVVASCLCLYEKHRRRAHKGAGGSGGGGG